MLLGRAVHNSHRFVRQRQKRESQCDAAAADICLFNSRNMFTLLLLFSLFVAAVSSKLGDRESCSCCDDVFKLSKSQPGLRLLSVVSLSLRTSARRARGELNGRPGREPENSLSLSLRWRPAATGDETVPLWAASPGAGREFTTYSKTSFTSTLWLISS